MDKPDWIEITQGDAPLLLSLPHTGTEIPEDVLNHLVSPWLARKDADWWIEKLYAFAAGLGATLIRTRISRTVIDVNRDPSGVSLYPGQATTGLCPLETFDGEALYQPGHEPDAAEIARRTEKFFAPYHQALAAELERLRARHARVVLYDCHSIRSQIPRLFAGLLPEINIGTNGGTSCAPEVTALVEQCAAASSFTHVTNGRFKGGWITRHYGEPAKGVHAVQIELAMRGYMAEKIGAVAALDWPPAYDGVFAGPLQDVLRGFLQGLIGWAQK